MANSVDMICRLSIGKDTEKYHPYINRVSDSGWETKILKLSAKAGDSMHTLSLKGFHNTNAGADDTFTIFTKSQYDSEGNVIKESERETVNYEDRNDPDILKRASNMSKFVIDLATPEQRKVRNAIARKVRNKETLTDEDFKSLGVDNEDDAKKAFKALKNLHHEYLHCGDYIDFIKEMIDGGQYANKKFHIVHCPVVYQYNLKHADGQPLFYESFEPNSIYLADDDAIEYAEQSFEFLFNGESLDTSSKKDGQLFLDGWVINRYDSTLKKTSVPVPLRVVYHVPTNEDLREKQISYLEKKFKARRDEIKMIKLTCDVINGSPRAEVTYEMLSEEQKERHDLWGVSLEELAREMGGYVRGPRVHEIRFKTPDGEPEATEYHNDDMQVKIPDSEENPFEKAETKPKAAESEEDDDDWLS